MSGRWPANVILSPATAKALDGQSGITPSNHRANKGDGGNMGYHGGNGSNTAQGQDDSGGASRFFLTAGYEPWELEWIIANGLTPCGT